MTLSTNSIVTPQVPDAFVMRFVGTTDPVGTPKNAYVNPGTDAVDVVGLIVTNGATSHNISLLLVSGGTTYTMNDVAVGANAGQNGTVVPVNFLSPTNWPGLPVDSNGNPFFRIPGSGTIQLQYATAQGTADTIYGYGAVARFS